MSKVRRTFSGTEAALLRRGRLLNRLTNVSGATEGGVPKMAGALQGRQSFWVVPGAQVTLAWRVTIDQPNSAWLEADAVIVSVDEAQIAVQGVGPCRPSRKP